MSKKFFLIFIFQIDWPLRLATSSPNSDWLLYILEEPLIRHNGQFRRCPILNTHLPSSKLINPLNIYNDATLKLDYYLSKSPYRQRKPRNLILINSTKEEEENLKLIRHGSILQLNSPLWPKWINEESGERVKVVDIVRGFFYFFIKIGVTSTRIRNF